jgi:2-desacetyl-2-hydroxyethyl bacteriochlorophyllide A dehydrogenase
MRAIVFREGRKVALEHLPDPKPGPGEVTIAVKASGICHTDIEILRGNYGSSAFPLVPGHEFAGEVMALGQGVTNVSTGDRVVVDPNLGCGVCLACLRGRVNLCEKLGAYGVTRNGGFAELCVVTADHIHPIGTLDWPVAALAEPLGCVLNGLSTLEGRVCNDAVVIGAGPIGLLMALALKWRGTENVTVVDLSEERLNLAETFGLKTLAAGSAALANLHHSQDFVADATGVPKVAESLVSYARDGGAALFFGVCPQPARIQISPFEVFRRQLSLFGTHSLNANIPETLPILQKHEREAARLVSHRAELSEIEAVFQNGPPKGALKVQAIFR